MASGVAAIHREAERGFNSVWEVVEKMQMNQELMRGLPAQSGERFTPDDAQKLRERAASHQQSLVKLMSHLSFHDVLRQRVDKVQLLIEQLEKQVLALMIKVKADGESIRDASQERAPQTELDQISVDQLLDRLK